MLILVFQIDWEHILITLLNTWISSKLETKTVWARFRYLSWLKSIVVHECHRKETIEEEKRFFFSLKLKKTNTKQTCVKFKLQNICTHLMKCNDDNLRTFYEMNFQWNDLNSATQLKWHQSNKETITKLIYLTGKWIDEIKKHTKIPE